MSAQDLTSQENLRPDSIVEALPDSNILPFNKPTETTNDNRVFICYHKQGKYTLFFPSLLIYFVKQIVNLFKNKPKKKVRKQKRTHKQDHLPHFLPSYYVYILYVMNRY